MKPACSISLEHERAFGEGVTIMGIDEAGRGPLAGPVFAAAVSVPLDRAADLLANEWQAVNDSKKLSPARRDALRRAALSLAEVLDNRRPASVTPPAPSSSYRILVDGLPVPTLPFPSKNLVKGDAKSLFIAAASILAKTARDAYCMEMDTRFPGYGFAVHKGYPTPAHLAALARLGPCPEHRQSFGPVAEAIFFRGGA